MIFIALDSDSVNKLILSKSPKQNNNVVIIFQLNSLWNPFACKLLGKSLFFQESLSTLRNLQDLHRQKEAFNLENSKIRHLLDQLENSFQKETL